MSCRSFSPSVSLTALRQQLANVMAPPPVAGDGIPTGIPPLDAALTGGGLPCGRLIEMVGARGGGKTTVIRTIVAQAIADKRWVAYIDAGRTLAPADWAPLAASERLWIVRPPDGTRPTLAAVDTAPPDPPPSRIDHGAWCADVLLRSGAFGLVVLDGAPTLARGVAVRLTRLARESHAAFVVLRDDDAPGRGTLVGGAVRIRVARRPRWSITAKGIGFIPGMSSPDAPPSLRTTITLAVSVEKGGTYHAVEVGCAIDVARRLCAHSEIPDRRGVASRNRRGERAAPDAPGVRRAAEPSHGTPAAPLGTGGGATLAHKRRCAEPAITHHAFLFPPDHPAPSAQRVPDTRIGPPLPHRVPAHESPSLVRT